MNKKKFKIGDKVSYDYYTNNTGYEGFIVCILDEESGPDHMYYGIEFTDNFAGQHNLKGELNGPKGYYVQAHQITLISRDWDE